MKTAWGIKQMAQIYDTGIMKLKYETEEELRILQGMYPNEGFPCPPPPIGDDEFKTGLCWNHNKDNG